jgi:hypothetical protein
VAAAQSRNPVGRPAPSPPPSVTNCHADFDESLFKAYEEFGASAITERGDLYRGIAKKVWNPDDLLAVAEDID